MWQLRSDLLGVSPHVSKEVLITTSEKTEVFPESVLFEILTANPDELKNGDMISFLENKEEPLPSYMIEMLQQIAGGVTYKTILKRQMADFHAQKSQAARDIIRSILADSVMNVQLYRNWLDNLGGIGSDKHIIASYIYENDFTNAQSLLNILPSLYDLQGDRLNKYNDYKSLIEMEISLKQQNRNIMQLDSTEIAYLIDFADNSTGTARVAARGILEFGYGYEYCDCPVLGDTLVWKNSGGWYDEPDDNNGLIINIEPNPARTWVAFNYKLPAYADKANLIITDISGKEIAVLTVNTKQGQKVWDIRKIERGVYLYTLKAGSVSKSGKLIIE